MKTAFKTSKVISLVRNMVSVSIILFGAAGGASASGSATANSSANIIQGIQIVNNTNLRFGALIPSGTSGTVTIGVNGSRTQTGGITLLSASSFPFTASTFTLTGAPNQSYTITLPTSVILTLQGGSSTVVVGTFVSSPAATGALSSSGTGTLAVGGTLTVPGSQTAGYYSGQFTVTLIYE